jgi:hypothetical protein
MTDDLYFLVMESISLAVRTMATCTSTAPARRDASNQVTKGRWALASAGGVAFWCGAALVGVDEKMIDLFHSARTALDRKTYRAHADGSGMMRISKAGTHHLDVT